MNDEMTKVTFLVRCLNAAANLYGVLRLDEFLDLFNQYAKGHSFYKGEPLQSKDFFELVNDYLNQREGKDDFDCESEDVWFVIWPDHEHKAVYVLASQILENSDLPLNEMKGRKEIAERVDDLINDWVTEELKILPEEVFFEYEDPLWGESSEALEDLVRLFGGHGDIDLDDDEVDDDAETDETVAWMDATRVQSFMRINGATIINGLECLKQDEIPIADKEEYRKLIDCLARLVPDVRTWDGRGWTQRELVDRGLLSRLAAERLPTFEEYQDLDEIGEEKDEIDEEKDDKGWEPDAWDTGVLSPEETFQMMKLPPASYPSGPVDFTFVKDRDRREKVLREYEDLRNLTREFVVEYVMREMTSSERQAAMRRLGFTDEDLDGIAGHSIECVVGDFAAMMDDQNGEPAIKRVLARMDTLPEWAQAAAAFYQNYRYTWLEVTAVKSGVGVKCRNLLTGEELFLMEKSLSQSPNVKGMTICAGIAPMGEVYLSLGAISPASFENPAVILKIVLAHLGIPSELPIRLSFADQARFAEETIKRLHALGKFATIYHGMS